MDASADPSGEPPDGSTTSDPPGGLGQRGSEAHLTLQPAVPADWEFLYRVYAESRADEMALIADWSDERKEAFLRFQFQAQHAHYEEHYPDAAFDLILKDGVAIGRFYVCDLGKELRLMDIALIASERNQGLGTALMLDLLDRAERQGKFISLHVEEHNPAKRLYERLGFRDAGQVTFYTLMHWRPATARTDDPA